MCETLPENSRDGDTKKKVSCDGLLHRTRQEWTGRGLLARPRDGSFGWGSVPCVVRCWRLDGRGPAVVSGGDETPKTRDVGLTGCSQAAENTGICIFFSTHSASWAL